MSYMFRVASAFDKTIGNWNTAKVTDVCYQCDQTIGNWSTAKVTDMSYMFRVASARFWLANRLSSVRC